MTSEVKLVLKAHPIDVSVKTKTAITNSHRSVNARVSHPVSGMANALVVAGRRIELSLAQRPRVVNLLGRNLINGFDSSLASLQEADGGKETFASGIISQSVPAHCHDFFNVSKRYTGALERRSRSSPRPRRTIGFFGCILSWMATAASPG